MINLLPPDIKDNYRFGRRNSRLIGWLTSIGLAFVGLALLSAGGLWYLKQEAKQYQTQISIAQQDLERQDQKQTEKQVKDISDNLKLAVQVLSKEVLFSQLLKQLAVVTPDNASLSSLTISQVQGAVDISANTTDYDAATQLQVNLADPANKIFSKADIVSINCGTTAAGSTATASRYPCQVNVRALFADNNPFLFIRSNARVTP